MGWDNIVSGVSADDPEAILQLVTLKYGVEKLEEWSDENKSFYMEVVRLLRGYYSRQGMPAQQAELLDGAIELIKKKDGRENSSYTRELYRLAALYYYELGDKNGALEVALNVRAMYQSAQDYGFDYANLLHDIGLYYLGVGNVDYAEQYVASAINLYHDLAQDSSFVKPASYADCYSQSLNTYGMILEKQKHYDEAIEVLKAVMSNTTPGSPNSLYMVVRNNLATVLLKLGRYGEARRLLNSTEAASLGFAVAKYSNLAILDYLTNDAKSAPVNLKNYNLSQCMQILGVAAAYSESERIAYLPNMASDLDFINNMLAYRFPALAAVGFDGSLFARSVGMAVDKAVKDVVKTGGDSISAHLNYLHGMMVKKGLADEQRASIAQEIIAGENTLMRSSPQMGKKIYGNMGNISDITERLRQGEAVVMFCYLPEMGDSLSSTMNFGAYVVLPHSDSPQLVRLCDARVLEKLLLNMSPSVDFVSDLYSKKKAHGLYTMLWKPLESLLKDANCVYYSTCGSLNLLNHEALVDDKGRRQGFSRKMVCLSSPNLVGRMSAPISGKNLSDITLFGAPDFNLSPADMENLSSQYSQFSGQKVADDISVLRGELMRSGWSLLPGTKAEIDAICTKLQAKHVEAKRYIGTAATEEALKALSGHSPQVLHIATHGFAITTQQQYEKSGYAQATEAINERSLYMQWSGLVLAGGNNTWLGKDVPADVEDGILTADEISRLDLSGTKLVVLSACDTGLGHIDPLEGVLGLQRAFKQAGVESILMTLWKIPDSTTAMFMEKFYERLLAGDTVRQAVKAAQQHLIAGGASDPFYWAAFTVLD